MATFLQLTGVSDKATALAAAPDSIESAERYSVPAELFRSLPTKPIAYWVSNSVLQLFEQESQQQTIPRVAKNGLGTLGDFRFVRLIFESEMFDRLEFPDFCKGGKRSPYFQEVFTTVNWADDGREVKAHIVHRYGGGHWSRNARSVEYYGRPGITWPLRGARFSAQAMQREGVFSVGGKMMFAESNSDSDLIVLLWLMNSRAFNDLLMLFAGKVSGAQYESGLIEMLPIPDVSTELRTEVTEVVVRLWNVYRQISADRETSRFFVGPSLLLTDGSDLDERVQNAISRRSELLTEAAELSQHLDELAEELYGLDEKFRRDASRLFPSDEAAEDGKGRRRESSFFGLTRQDAVESLLSWLLGGVLGRFSPQIEGRREHQRDPFAPLSRPASGVRKVQGDGSGSAGLAMGVVDKGSPLDLEAAMELFLSQAVGDRESAARLWADLQRELEAAVGSVSGWLSSKYFDRHLSEYSASQRKAPVYWPIGTRSGGYTVWLYAHRVTSDAIYRVLNDVVAPKLGLERRRLSELVQESGPAPTSSQRKAVENQEEFVAELEELVEDLSAVAPLWKPSLSDGVVVLLAPCWRLFRHHRAWSAELRNRWEKLAAGEYDWAHVAMHLWPERVVPKCADDRSLAIAHGLDEVFWVQDEENSDKWHPRETPSATFEQLIADRTDPATKAALEGLDR